MVEEEGIVVAVNSSTVMVETQRRSVCGQCAANKGCGTSLLQKAVGKKRTVVQVLKTFPVTVGQPVVIGLDESAFVKGSVAVYAVPLLAMIVFGIAGEMLSNYFTLPYNDGVSILSALLGFVVSIVAIRRFSVSIANDPRYQPVLLRQTKTINIEPNFKILT